MKPVILLVDDDETHRERLARAIRSREFEVHEAPNAHVALELTESHRPDAIIMDLRMPGDSGVHLIEKLLTLAPESRVVVLTGFGSIASALEAVRLGAIDYLSKPSTTDQVLAALGFTSDATQQPVQETVPSLERVEWEHIQRVLSECGGNISHAARILGIHRRSLQRKLEKFPPNR